MTNNVETQRKHLYSLYTGSLCNIAFPMARFTCIVTLQVFVKIWLHWSISLSSAFKRDRENIYEKTSALTKALYRQLEFLLSDQETKWQMFQKAPRTGQKIQGLYSADFSQKWAKLRRVVMMMMMMMMMFDQFIILKTFEHLQTCRIYIYFLINDFFWVILTSYIIQVNKYFQISSLRINSIYDTCICSLIVVLFFLHSFLSWRVYTNDFTSWLVQVYGISVIGYLKVKQSSFSNNALLDWSTYQ